MSHSPFDEPDAGRLDERSASAAAPSGWAPPSPGGNWPEPDGRPRLRLQHMFAYTAMAALLMALGDPRMQLDVQSPNMRFEFLPWQRAAMVGLWIVNTLLSAAVLTCLAYGFAWRRRGLPFWQHPGHWLLADLGVQAVAGVAMQLGFRVVRAAIGGFDDADDAIAMPYIALSLVSVVFGLGLIGVRLALNIYVAVQRSPESRWRWVFILKAIATVAAFIGDIIVVVLVLVAAHGDRTERTPRDAAHRCGVWLQVVMSSMMILTMMITWWIMLSQFLFR
jgi:hypothetical protein